MLPQAIDNTFVLPFNDLAAVAETLRHHGHEVAAIILEPIQHNIGCILPQPGFLAGLRALTRQYGVVLIFDEVITGFRHDLGGYQQVAGVTPDLTTMAKAVANGYPLALLAGRADLLEHCRPGGDVFMAGTFNAHPVGVAAALATLGILARPGTYAYLFALGERMRAGLRALLQKHEVHATVAGFGSVFVTYFMQPPITSYTDLLRNDAALFVTYRRKLIARGVYKLPVNLKRSYIGMSHTVTDIDETLAAVDEVLKELVQVRE
jgi:glutamate-1-semialdehyde 2,1-aminomutase